jgi:hypothetical protein
MPTALDAAKRCYEAQTELLKTANYLLKIMRKSGDISTIDILIGLLKPLYRDYEAIKRKSKNHVPRNQIEPMPKE